MVIQPEHRYATGMGRQSQNRLQCSGLAGAIAADQAENFAMADFQPHVAQSPEKFLAGLAHGCQRRASHARKKVAQSFRRADYTTPVALTEAFGADDDVRHCRLVYL